MKKGDKCSKNFVLKNKLERMNDVVYILENEPSLFVGHKVYPSAFIWGWNLRTINIFIKAGRIWSIERTTK
jgi:hypothetical protein